MLWNHSESSVLIIQLFLKIQKHMFGIIISLLLGSLRLFKILFFKHIRGIQIAQKMQCPKMDGRLNDSTKSLFKPRLKINCIDNYWHELVHDMLKHIKTHESTWSRGKWSGYMIWYKKTWNAWQWMGYITPVTRQHFWYHILIMRLQTLVYIYIYVVTWDVSNLICIKCVCNSLMLS